jgi:hypothetical protein
MSELVRRNLMSTLSYLGSLLAPMVPVLDESSILRDTFFMASFSH